MGTEIPRLERLRAISPQNAAPAIGGTCIALLGLLAFVVYGHGRAQTTPNWLSWLPAVNAALNATSAVFLLLAYRAVRRKAFRLHARLMLWALSSSALFLLSYLAYHSLHGDSRFGGHGPVRAVYFFILITHVVLSAVVLPFILTSLFLSLSGRFQAHKSVSRYTLPIWLYVSVTGVLVFGLLRWAGPR